MANWKRFFKKKRFWLALIIFLGLGFFLYSWFQKIKIPEEGWPIEIPEEFKEDKIPPLTAIVSPEDKSWWNRDFEVEIYDSDLGSGLIEFSPGKSGCKYIIEDLGTNQAIGDFRKCDPVKINVPVGEEKTCSSSFQKDDISQGKCKVSTIAFDKAGNNSGWKSRVYNIDLINPIIQEIVLPPTSGNGGGLELNQNYLFQTSVSDNSKIIGCWFYVNGKIVGGPLEIKPIPCENENQCLVSLNYSFKEEGDYQIKFGCADFAGNLGLGNPVIAKVTTNHPPKITFCRISPTQGTIITDFQFQVEAADPDGDEISYLWNFGDGESSTEKEPIHLYQKTGTFEPKVTVSDNKGGESKCQAAWATVVKE